MELRENETVIGAGRIETDGHMTAVDICYGNCILLPDGSKGALPPDTYQQLLDAYLAELMLPEECQTDPESPDEDETDPGADLELSAQPDQIRRPVKAYLAGILHLFRSQDRISRRRSIILAVLITSQILSWTLLILILLGLLPVR